MMFVGGEEVQDYFSKYIQLREDKEDELVCFAVVKVFSKKLCYLFGGCVSLNNEVFESPQSLKSLQI